MTNSPRWRDDADDRGRGSRASMPRAVTVGEGRCAVRLELIDQGRDLVLLITGGDAHVGAAAVCAPQGPGGAKDCHTAVLPPHKEGPLAAECAARVAEAAGCTVCAVAGIHLDAITEQEIAAVTDNARRGAGILAARLNGEEED